MYALTNLFRRVAAFNEKDAVFNLIISINSATFHEYFKPQGNGGKLILTIDNLLHNLFVLV